MILTHGKRMNWPQATMNNHEIALVSYMLSFDSLFHTSNSNDHALAHQDVQCAHSITTYCIGEYYPCVSRLITLIYKYW